MLLSDVWLGYVCVCMGEKFVKIPQLLYFEKKRKKQKTAHKHS